MHEREIWKVHSCKITKLCTYTLHKSGDGNVGNCILVYMLPAYTRVWSHKEHYIRFLTPLHYNNNRFMCHLHEQPENYFSYYYYEMGYKRTCTTYRYWLYNLCFRVQIIYDLCPQKWFPINFPGILRYVVCVLVGTTCLVCTEHATSGHTSTTR